MTTDESNTDMILKFTSSPKNEGWEQADLKGGSTSGASKILRFHTPADPALEDCTPVDIFAIPQETPAPVFDFSQPQKSKEDKILIDSGTLPPDEQLHHAIDSGDNVAVLTALKSGADINSTKWYDEERQIGFACGTIARMSPLERSIFVSRSSKKEGALGFMLERGANPLGHEQDGMPLVLAIEFLHPIAAEMLLHATKGPYLIRRDGKELPPINYLAEHTMLTDYTKRRLNPHERAVLGAIQRHHERRYNLYRGYKLAKANVVRLHEYGLA